MTIGLAVKLDPTGDIELETDADGNVDFKLIEGVDEVAQALSIRLRTFEGEDRTDQNVGVRWDRIIALFTPEIVQGIVSRAILLEPRVQSVGEITTSLEPANRVLTIEVPVVLKDGQNLTLIEAFGV